MVIGDDGTRGRILAAVTHLIGSRGRAQVNLQQVLDEANTHSRSFHRHFESLDDAFDAAYESCGRELVDGLLEAGRTGADWRSGYRSALVFLTWTTREPEKARLLMVEYQSAGTPAVKVHESLCDQLARALDACRGETDPADQPPEMTADFLIAGIEASIADLVRRGQESFVGDLGPELLYLGVLLYLGQEAADAERDRSRTEFDPPT